MQVNANPESFQAQYERLVENWLTKFAQINQELLKNLEVSVVDEKGEKQTLYGTSEFGEKICDISPEQIQKIESGELKPDIQVSKSLEKAIEAERLALHFDKLSVREVEESRSMTPIQPDQIKIFVQDEMGESEMIYGKAGSQIINRLVGEQIEQLRAAYSAELGDKTILEPFKVKIGEEIVFQVDGLGTVIANSGNLRQVLDILDEPVQEQKQEQSLPVLDDYSDDYDYSGYDFEAVQEDVLVELVSDLVEGLPDPVSTESEPEIQDELEEFFEVDLTEYTPIVIPEIANTSISLSVEDVPLQKQEEGPQKTGLYCLEESVGQLKDGTLKTILTQATQELRVEVSSQEPNPEIDQLIEARTQASQDPNWWQRTTSKAEEMVTAVRDSFVGNRAASTLKQFADKLDLQSGSSFEGAEYNLKREGKDYTLTDKQGNELLKFKSSVLGVKVDSQLPGLDEGHFRKIEGLRKDLSSGVQPQGAFVSEGKAEAEYLKRVSAITNALSRYATQKGGTAKIEGKFSYDWQANSSGSVMIKNKQGEVLMACGQGHMRSRMSEKDLQHFEQMLPNLEMQKQTSIGVKRQMEVG